MAGGISLLLAALGLSAAGVENSHPVIDAIGPGLKARNIDHRASYSMFRSEVERPTLSPLEGFPTDLHGMGGAEFELDFNGGATGVIMGIRSSEPLAASNFGTFTERWYGSPPEERVFVSFTRADLPTANIVREELEAKGYTTYLYINEPDSQPKFPARQVGQFFRTAGHHLVIDSPNARQSRGVAYESYWYRKLPPAKDRRDRPKGADPSEDEECFECCSYDGHKLLGCYPLGCGEEAHREGMETCNSGLNIK